jgi:Tat protein translocase TatB subunit
MLNIGPQELILVLIIALVVVGPSRLPELGRTIGKALREFRKVQDEVKDTFRLDLSDDASAGSPPPRPHRPRRGASDGEPTSSVDEGGRATTPDADAGDVTASSDQHDPRSAPTPAGDADTPDIPGSGPTPETSA